MRTRSLYIRRRRARDRPGEATAQPRRGDRTGGSGRPRRLRRRRAPPPRLRRLVAGRRVGGCRRAHEDIRLTSAVTVLSSDDPVRVFQDFATLDLISAGGPRSCRPRLVYRVVPAVRLRPRRLRRAVRREARAAAEAARVRASHVVGQAPRAARDAGVFPRPVQDPLPIWDRRRRHAAGRSSVPRCSACRLPSLSSAASPRTSRRSPGSTAKPRTGPATTRRRYRSASTRTPTWPRRPRGRATSTSQPTPR
jgi:hypothetical protein